MSSFPRAVLVTGASSPLGRAVIARLAQSAGVERVLGVLEPGSPVPTPGTKAFFVAADLTRPRDVRNLLFGPALDAGVEAIVHAPMQRDPQEHDPRARALIVESTRSLLALAEPEPAIRRFVLLSAAEVYHVASSEPQLLDEDQPLQWHPTASERVRARVEADLLACAKASASRLRIAVLRLSELLCPDVGSELYDYLRPRVCLRAVGYDPMLNVLSLDDAADAVERALQCDGIGPFNVPGLDALPLSELIHESGRIDVALPGPLLSPLYGLRARVASGRFSYRAERQRMHYSALLDGSRAARELGYRPSHAIALSSLFGTEPLGGDGRA